MKFEELRALLREEMKVSIGQNPDKAKYIAPAYNRVISHMRNLFKDTDRVSLAKILDLEITNYMKGKLLELSKKTVPETIKK